MATTMDFASRTVLLFLTISFVLCAKRVISHFLDPLRGVPGPFFGRFTRLWFFVDLVSQRGHETSEKLHEKYGPVVRIAPDTYSIADLDVAKHLYAARTRYEKSEWYGAWTSPGDDTIFTVRNEKRFADVKRKFADSYTMGSVVQYEQPLNDCIRVLCQKFTEKAKINAEVDLARWMRLFALDGLWHLIFGETAHGLELEDDQYGILHNTRMSSYYGTVVGSIPEIHPWLWMLMPSGKSEKMARKFVHDRVSKIRADRSRDGKKASCLVDVWMQRTEQEAMTERDIHVGVGASLGAGTETTSHVLSTIFFLLHKHPEVLKKLQSEIDEAVKKEGTTNGLISYETARQLPYLQAVIKESHRLYPAVGNILPRVVPKGGETLAGRYFREGLIVGVNLWPTRKSPKYWGEDAALYRPERWLGAEEEVRRNENYHMPFSIGQRSCLGKNIATFEAIKVVANLVHRFSIRIVYPEKESDLRFGHCHGLLPDAMRCRIELR